MATPQDNPLDELEQKIDAARKQAVDHGTITDDKSAGCTTCAKPVDPATGFKVSTGWDNEAERLDYEFCGADCLREHLDRLPLQDA